MNQHWQEQLKENAEKQRKDTRYAPSLGARCSSSLASLCVPGGSAGLV